jgi:integration host factor subunit beta
MTRSELIDHLADRFPLLTAKDVESAVKEMTEAIGHTLARGSRVEIRGFGSFTINYRPPRMGRNPKTGEPVGVPAKWLPYFKPGKEMRERIDDSVIPASVRKVA